MNLSSGELKQALKCCGDCNGAECRDCPCNSLGTNCEGVSLEALDYIERLEQKADSLQAKNKRLEDRLSSQKHALFEQQSYTAELQKELDLAKFFHKEVIAERNLLNAKLLKAEEEIVQMRKKEKTMVDTIQTLINKNCSTID